MGESLSARRALIARAEHRLKRDPSAVAEVETARRDYYAEKLATYVAEVVEKAPPFTDEQVARLARILFDAQAAS